MDEIVFPFTDTRNVIDRFKGWKQEDIKQELQKTSLPYAALMEQWSGDFNVSTLIRNANAFAAREVFYIGKRHIDRRGAVGSYHYTTVSHLRSYDELKFLKDQYCFIGIDNISGAINLSEAIYPKNPLFIFGEEGKGLTKEMVDLCSFIVQIPMFGSIRSLNAGTASGIIFHDFAMRNNR
jgi:tRNA G18 (ribose-2'-O)-methylase SpoU